MSWEYPKVMRYNQFHFMIDDWITSVFGLIVRIGKVVTSKDVLPITSLLHYVSSSYPTMVQHMCVWFAPGKCVHYTNRVSM